MVTLMLLIDVVESIKTWSKRPIFQRGIAHQRSMIFVTWHGYDGTGKPIWYRHNESQHQWRACFEGDCLTIVLETEPSIKGAPAHFGAEAEC